MEMKNSRAEGFSTPLKNRTGFMSASDAFETPASVFNPRFGSNMATPHSYTSSKIQEHDSTAPNLHLMNTDEIPTLKQEITIQEIVHKINEAFSVQSKTNWINKVEAITVLRALNKTYPDEIFDVFMHFGDQIMVSLGMKVPLIHKNILAFIYEVLTIKRKKPLDEAIIERLIPILINRMRSSSKLIRNLARESLMEVCQPLICNSSLMKLAEMSLDKNSSYADMAFKGLALSINNLGESISQINTRTLQGIFVVFTKIVFHKSGTIAKIASDGANYLQKLMGFENYTRMLKILIDEGHITRDEANQMVNVVNSQPRPSGKEIRTEAKRQFSELKHSVRRQHYQQDYGIQVLPDKQTVARESNYDRYSNSGHTYFGNFGQQSSFFR